MGMDTSYIEDGNSEYLYSPGILQKLNFDKSPAIFKPKISAANPGESWMVVRPLQRSDFDKGFLQLLGQLTSTGNISRKQFDERFTQMKNSGGYYVTVIEDKRNSKIIGAATLTVEQKFIHNCSLRGRLEDVVVNDTYRGKQLGKLIVVTVSLLAQELGCYKMSLDCKDKLIKFYETLGYKMEPGNSNAMNMRFEEPS
ncbi:probable glucosamine 6-phosphate N-acetyltransferase [Aricia agestis]|uniref:probable glucosamine 6-phosphate N-acetyltransferase n=1 Tax=Aricia agestis TaxID=91739 RepID=UPI001C20B017|nr:probable glucosamine 6-phosphate N-acetyltransferase [Aricia agestis]XP_041969350.1 probable glucosamine 6-phosphate N-acetyltransferase [Aricia agestis]XP_041969351.1 probable glucosamine 6-phosphate N-acetyltransferase [Aricia agestis]